MTKSLFSDCHTHTHIYTKAKLYGTDFHLYFAVDFPVRNLNKVSNFQLEALFTHRCNVHLAKCELHANLCLSNAITTVANVNLANGLMFKIKLEQSIQSSSSLFVCKSRWRKATTVTTMKLKRISSLQNVCNKKSFINTNSNSSGHRYCKFIIC